LLQNTDAANIRALYDANSAKEATAAFRRVFEKAEVPHDDGRIARHAA
jgi:hypothetical protein